jgi:cytochrome c peroxidase
MHTGMFELRGVLNMYNAGMVTLKRQPYQHDDPLVPVKSPHLQPLGLNRQDIADLEAFLGALAEPRQRVLPPELPEIDAEPVSGEPR